MSLRSIVARIAAIACVAGALASPAVAGEKVMFNKSYNLGGTTESAPALLTYREGNQERIALFVRGTDNALWWRTGDGQGNWTDWASVPNGLFKGSPSCVYETHTKLVRCFVRGLDDALWATAYTPANGSWSAFGSLGGKLSSSPSAVYYRDNTAGFATFVFVRNTQSGLSAKQTAVWSGNQDLFAPNPDWGSSMGGQFAGEPSCYQEGISKGVNCLLRINGGGIRLWGHAEVTGAVSPDAHPTAGLPTESDDRVGPVKYLGHTYFFHRHPSGAFMVTHRNPQGQVDSQTDLFGLPTSGVSCTTMSHTSATGQASIWCAITTSTKQTSLLRYDHPKDLQGN